VSFIDTSTGSVIKTVNTAPYPSHITLNPNGTELHVSHDLAATISLIDTTTAVVRSFTVSERPQGGLLPTMENFFISAFIILSSLYRLSTPKTKGLLKTFRSPKGHGHAY
jgi:hypothetical protein